MLPLITWMLLVVLGATATSLIAVKLGVSALIHDISFWGFLLLTLIACIGAQLSVKK